MCKLLITALSSAIAVTGCSRSESFAERAARISKVQSQGVDGSTILVNRAYDYAGDSYHEKKPDQKLLAVDVTFQKPNAGLDLDDVEIVDGATNESLGSFPDLYLLTAGGELADQSAWPARKPAPDELRVLLIYQVLPAINSVKLRYWGKEMTKEPIAVSGTGPAVKKTSD